MWKQVFNLFIVVIYTLQFGFSCLALADDVIESEQTDITEEKVITIAPENTQLAKRMQARETIESPFEISIGVSGREDSLKWGLVAKGIDPSSELLWQDTAITQFFISGKFRFSDDWFVNGMYGSGSVNSGRNQDSDYAQSDHKGEYSRSYADTGGSVDDGLLALGYQAFKRKTSSNKYIVLSPMLGVSMHRQYLIMFNGQKTIPFEAPINDLENNYDTEWQSGWLGLNFDWGATPEFSLHGLIKYHFADFKAKANWNLREDFEHPLSFRHDAKGRATTVAFGASYFVAPRVAISLSGEYQEWITSEGVETTYFVIGPEQYTPMSDVVWRSTSIQLAIDYHF